MVPDQQHRTFLEHVRNANCQTPSNPGIVNSESGAQQCVFANPSGNSTRALKFEIPWCWGSLGAMGARKTCSIWSTVIPEHPGCPTRGWGKDKLLLGIVDAVGSPARAPSLGWGNLLATVVLAGNGS